MDATVLVAIIGAIEGIGVAIIGAMVAAANRRSDEYRKKREERDAAIYGLTFATANAVDVLLLVAHGDQVNGNVEEARSSMKNAKKACNDVFNRHAASI